MLRNPNASDEHRLLGQTMRSKDLQTPVLLHPLLHPANLLHPHDMPVDPQRCRVNPQREADKLWHDATPVFKKPYTAWPKGGPSPQSPTNRATRARRASSKCSANPSDARPASTSPDPGRRSVATAAPSQCLPVHEAPPCPCVVRSRKKSCFILLVLYKT